MVCGLVWLITFLILALILLVIGLFQFRKWKVMADTPTRMVVDIEPGRVEVNGRIEPVPGRLYHSPLTSTPCVNYKVEVQEYRSSGRSHYWATIHKNERGGPFLVTDESGKVLVDPKKAGLSQVQTMNSQQGMFNEMNHVAQDYIQRTGIRDKGFFGVFKRTLRVVESVIPAGQDLYVLGEAQELPMEPVLQNDPLVSPFTIKKKGLMILSYESETKLSNKKRAVWVTMLVIAGILGFVGVFGMFFLIV